MDVPEVAVEFFGETTRLAPENERFKGIYLAALKKTNFEEAKKIAAEVLAKPEGHDLALVTYAADVELASLNDEDGPKALERAKRMFPILETVIGHLLAGQRKSLDQSILGMAGMPQQEPQKVIEEGA